MKSTSRWGIVVLITWALYGVTLAVLGVAARAGSRRVVLIVGIGVALVTVLRHVVLRRERATDVADLAGRLIVPVVAFVLGAMLFVGWLTGARQDALWFVGLGLCLFGAAQVLVEVRLWLDREQIGRVVLVVPVALAAAGLAGVLTGASTADVVFLLVGLALLPIGLELTAEREARRDVSARPRVVAGAGLVALGTIGLVVRGGELGNVVVFVLVLAALVGLLAANTDLGTILVVTALAFVLALVPAVRDVPEEARPDDGEQVMVAFGDSYISGEGTTSYLAGTNDRGTNECRRAPTAYVVRAAQSGEPGVPEDLAFLACSGAKGDQIWNEVQTQGEPDDPVTGTGLTQVQQLAALQEAADFDIAVVLVSIGGNDAGFGDIGKACFAPGDCSQIAQRWLNGLGQTSVEIGEAYDEIRRAVPEPVPIVAVPYPQPVGPRACSYVPLTGNERRFIRGFVAELDDVVRRQAAAHGFFYLAEMRDALTAAHRSLCDDDAGHVGVNFIGLSSVSGLLEDRVNPQNWVHNSLHPNATGHRVLTQVLVDWLQAHEGVGPPPPVESPYETTTLGVLLDDEDFVHCGRPDSGLSDCDLEVYPWIAAKAPGPILGALPWVGMVMLGAWLLWIRAIHRWRERSS